MSGEKKINKKKNNLIRIAVIGCGRWGSNHIRIFNELPETQLVICCDRDKNRLDDLKIQYPHIEVTSDLKKVLTNQKVDAVIVATTPDETHFEIGKKVLRARKHAFIEKPLALSLKQAKELIDLAKAENKVLMTGHIYQYHPAIQRIKDYIQTREITPVSILSTRIESGIPANREDANLLWASAIHDVSIIQYLLGKEPQKVSAIQSSLNTKKMGDILFINLIFPNKVIGHIQAGFAGPYKERKLVIHSPQKILVFDGLTEILEVFSHQDFKRKVRLGSREYDKKFKKIQRIDFKDEQPLKIECQHFLDCINKNRIPLSGGKNVLKVFRTLSRINNKLNKL